MTAIGAAELLERPEFRTNDDRVRHRRAINAAIEERLRGETTEHWIATLNAAGVPCGRVMSLAEVFADPQILDQEMVVSADHPGRGEVKMLGFPVKFAGHPCRIHRPTPELGADTDDVLSELGLTAEEIAGLRARRIV
jgi:CoA:oxalate CoA-transferase